MPCAQSLKKKRLRVNKLRESHLVSLEHLTDYSAFVIPIWLGVDDPITEEEVRTAVESRFFLDFPINGGGKFVDSEGEPLGGLRTLHIWRVAYLVACPCDSPIHLDVGLPGYGSWWLVQDGHHRLAAAFFRGDSHIRAYVSGELAQIKVRLGIEL